jgi:UDP-glucose 4-epimerase
VIVVTGGLGFIGNELVRQLKKDGQSVTVIDNKNRIAPKIEDLQVVPVIEIDMTDFKTLSGWMKENKPEVIYHMAAIHYIPECNENPERTLRVNVEGTQSVLRAAAEAGVEKVVFASSGAVYADSGEALHESSPIAPVDVYGWTKLFGEQLCALNHQLFGTAIVMARLFNNYGPRETNPHIIPEILNQLRKSDQLSLGKITTVRDYIHTSDCAKALIKLAHHHKQGVERVNVATGSGYTVQQMIELIGEITGRSIKVQHDSQRVRRFDKQTQVADISHLKGLTNWEPEVNIRQGVKDLLMFEGLL